MATRNKIVYVLAGFLGIVVLLGIVLYFSVPKFINSEAVKEKVSAYFQQETGGSIDFQNAELIIYPIPHVAFSEVSFSIPGKAGGNVDFLDIYPDVWSLIRGDVKFSKIRIESPNVDVALSEDEEKPSLAEIEAKIRAIVHDLTSIARDLSVTIRKGSLDLSKGNQDFVSFSGIQSKITLTGKSVDISIAASSDLWESLSLKMSLQAEDLKSKGVVDAKSLRSDNLLKKFVPEIGSYIGDSYADLSVKFQGIGLRQIRAEIESSVPNLALIRGKNRTTIEDLNFKGEMGIDSKGVSVLLAELSTANPDLKISGKYALDRASRIMELELEGKAIDVQSTRSFALSLGRDVPVIRNIFDIVRGGKIPSLQFRTGGKSPADLGRLNNMRISGNMRKGDIYIKARDLSFQNVSGDVVISKGILEGKNIEASLDRHRAGKGKVTVGLQGRDAPFHLDMLVKADVAELPSLLKGKKLIRNEGVLQEMDRLSDTRGTAEGRLVLGERLDSIHVIADIEKINLTTRYEPLPFPLVIKGGQVLFDEKSISTTNLNGGLGDSSFSNLAAVLKLNDNKDFEISSGRMTLSAGELYPWVTSFESIKPILKEVPSMKGRIMVSSINFRGPLYQSKTWKYIFNGEVGGFTLDAAFLPGKAEETSGIFRITQDKLVLTDVRTRMVDSSFKVSGNISEFPVGIRILDLSFQGEAGPKVTAWIAKLTHLPAELSVRAPLTVSASHLLWDRENSAAFDGSLMFGGETKVALKLKKTADELSIDEITVKDRETDAVASLKFGKKALDFEFKGLLTSNTLKRIFSQSRIAGSSLEGDIRIHIVPDNLMQSAVEGKIAANNIPVPWKRDLPLVISHMDLNARGKRVSVNSAQLLIGEGQLSGRGIIDISRARMSVDMDLSSEGFEWETIEKIMSSAKKNGQGTKTPLTGKVPLQGTLRIQSGYFKYRQFSFEPFHAEVVFDENTIRIRPTKTALCGISTTGEIVFSDSGAEIDVALSAKKLELQPTVLCISNKSVDVTGRFELEADIKAKGQLDDLAKSVNGSFSFSAKKGKIYKSRSLERTLDLVNKTEDVKGKLPDLDKTVIDYRSFTASGSVRESTVEIQESVLDASRFGILAQGTVDLQSEALDLNALVAPLNFAQRLIGKIPILGHVLGGSLISIPVKIKGKLSDPQVDFLSPSAIGSAFVGIIERTIKLPITIIEPVLPGKKEE